jgi:hypothetical protein
MILWKRGVRYNGQTIHPKVICIVMKNMEIITMYAQDHTAEVYNYRVQMNEMMTDFRTIWPHLPVETKQKVLHEATRILEDRLEAAKG